jgi:UDP-N-acetylmuramoyl-tripeptide--D-alanyl-D-alanine ligase
MENYNKSFRTIEELYELYKQYPNISTDSRKIEKGDIFFALRGENFDGNKFAIKALEQGASLVVLDSEQIYLKTTNTNYQERMFLCQDSLETLQQLAAYHRDRLTTTIIGISGTNGKTTTKELIHAVLSSKFTTQATVGNLNNHIGVPLTLLSIKPQTQIAIVEMGANHVGEIAFLCTIAKPDMGILTNVGSAHIEGFKTRENIIKTKRALFESVKSNNKPNAHLFVNNDDEALCDENFSKKTTYSLLDSANYNAVSDSSNAVSTIHIEGLTIQSQLIGKYNAYNMLAAYTIGRHFGIDKHDIKHSIEQYKPSNQRSQIVKTARNTLILDCYNANPSSCKAAIESLACMQAERKMIFMGAMRELGDCTEEEHRNCLELMKSKDFERIILVGEEYKEMAKDEIMWFENSSQMREYLKEEQISGGTILIKGSRTTKMEILEDVL